MLEIIARCGYRCDLCPAYKENIKSEDDRQNVSDGWHKFYRFRIPPEKINCDGCLTDDNENPNLIDTKCKVRRCVLKKGLENCALCEQYPCKKLMPKFVDFDKVEKRLKKPIPTEERERFIKPYEARKLLDKIRK